MYLFSPLASLPLCQQSHGQRWCRGTNLPRAPHHRRGWHLPSWLWKQQHQMILWWLNWFYPPVDEFLRFLEKCVNCWFFVTGHVTVTCRLIMVAQGAWVGDHLGQATMDALRTTLPKTNSSRPWKWMVGKGSFPFGVRPIFRGYVASFRESGSQCI